jgi:hypothetical protein
VLTEGPLASEGSVLVVADWGVGLGKPGFTQLQLFWVPAHQDFGD